MESEAERGPNNEVKRVLDRLGGYPLLDALRGRRSRRFAKGLALSGGPLAFASSRRPEPLTTAEEAALAFAASGVTGYALAELPYQTDVHSNSGGGNIMTHFVGRTAPSGDGIHSQAVFVSNDDGTWMLLRPQDFPRTAVPELVAAARAGKLVDLYERSRVQIADARVEVPREMPFVPPFNTWSANRPGTTYFLPVAEVSMLYLNLLLAAFSEELGYFVVDERSGYRPAGLARFARSRGGHLHDNVAAGRVATVSSLETSIYELAAIEQGAIIQNLGLVATALGIGGFAHFASHPFAWPRALGFRMQDLRLSRIIGAGRVPATVMRLTRQDLPMPTAVGLERAGAILLKPFCPPYYASMAQAVRAFVDYKHAPGTGTQRDGGAATAWRDGSKIQAGIAPYSETAIAATAAYAQYVHDRYGRFPSAGGPFRTVVAFQAHHLDAEFYERFYRPDTLGLDPAGDAR